MIFTEEFLYLFSSLQLYTFYLYCLSDQKQNSIKFQLK